jgi:hypothetical protein
MLGVQQRSDHAEDVGRPGRTSAVYSVLYVYFMCTVYFMYSVLYCTMSWLVGHLSRPLQRLLVWTDLQRDVLVLAVGYQLPPLKEGAQLNLVDDLQVRQPQIPAPLMGG